MSKDKVVVGIDVGSSKVTTIITTVSSASSVNIIGVSSQASRGLRKGQVVDIDEAVASITASLEAAERMAGYSAGTAFVFVEGAPAYCSVLPIGARNVTNDLAIGLRISLDSAEKIKLALSRPPKIAVEVDEKGESVDKK